MKARLITYTVICRELVSPLPPVYPDPLIYDIQVPQGTTDVEALFLDEIAKIRFEELGKDNPELLPLIRKGLTIDFAFEGDLSPVFDFRE